MAAQTPFRRSLINAEVRDRSETHWQRARQIVEDAGGAFYELRAELPLGDEHFADATHLLESGARRFASALLDRVLGP